MGAVIMQIRAVVVGWLVGVSVSYAQQLSFVSILSASLYNAVHIIDCLMTEQQCIPIFFCIPFENMMDENNFKS